MPSNETAADAASQGLFLTTHWSVVLAAKNKASPACARALETLCQTYWFPLYAFIRSSGYTPPDAQDLTQEFFSRFLAKDYLRVVDPGKGRFRTFLRMALKRFLANQWEHRRAEKRGGHYTHLSFDTTWAEQQFESERIDALAPDQIYDRRWALALLDQATTRLEREYAATRRTPEWNQLKPYLTAERGQIPYAEIAAALRTSEGAARVAIHRLRRRFREVFREAVAETVSAPQEAEEELRQILQVLASCS